MKVPGRQRVRIFNRPVDLLRSTGAARLLPPSFDETALTCDNFGLAPGGLPTCRKTREAKFGVQLIWDSSPSTDCGGSVDIYKEVWMQGTRRAGPGDVLPAKKGKPKENRR
jgi:hypothetical protein